MRKPNLPDASGLLRLSYSPVEESANRVGRLLHRLADPGLTEAVVTEVDAEVDAVLRAERGDLTGRAVRVTALDWLDVSPVQVMAADELLRSDPLRDDLLSAAIDPAAACVAAAHWMCAAAVVAAEAAGNTPGGVSAEADDIQPVAVQVPSHVVEQVELADRSPRVVVLDLLRVCQLHRGTSNTVSSFVDSCRGGAGWGSRRARPPPSMGASSVPVRDDQTVRLGAVEEWTVVNVGSMDHRSTSTRGRSTWSPQASAHHRRGRSAGCGPHAGQRVGRLRIAFTDYPGALSGTRIT